MRAQWGVFVCLTVTPVVSAVSMSAHHRNAGYDTAVCRAARLIAAL